MNVFLFVLACATALAWVPIFLDFFRSWRSRRNPVSLAICMLIGFPVWASAAVYWLFFNVVPAWYVGAALVGTNLLLCVLFHISFYLARKRFPDSRNL